MLRCAMNIRIDLLLPCTLFFLVFFLHCAILIFLISPVAVVRRQNNPLLISFESVSQPSAPRATVKHVPPVTETQTSVQTTKISDFQTLPEPVAEFPHPQDDTPMLPAYSSSTVTETDAYVRTDSPYVGTEPVKDTILIDFESVVLQHLEKSKVYPVVARKKGIEGSVRVSFKVLSTGRIADLHVTGDDAHRLLLQAAATTVRTAAPFPVPIGAKTPLYIEAILLYQLTKY